MKQIGLRTEILMTLALLLGAALLLGGLLFLRVAEKNLLEQRLIQLRAVSQTLSVALVTELIGGGSNDSSLKFSQLNRLPVELAVIGWSVYDQNLNLLSASFQTSCEPFSAASLQLLKFSNEIHQELTFPSPLEFFSQTGAEVRFLVPLLRQQRFVGVMGLVVSLRDVQLRLFGILQMVLISVLFYGAVLISVGFVLLQRNLITPAQRLLLATEKVADGDLTVKLPVSGPREIMQLAESFNRMTDAVLTSQLQAELNFEKVEAVNGVLQKTRDELIRSEKAASVGQLAAGLAHELGNPLAALIGYLEILKLRRLPATELDLIERSGSEAERLNLLVREMLDFSRPTSNLPQLVNLSTALKATVQLLEDQGLFAGCTFRQAFPEDLPKIYIGEHRFQQVLINLLNNAVQACSPDNTIVELIAGYNEKEAWFEVRDNGNGIADLALQKIFDPFYTTKEPGQGTGLGLAVCQRIIADAGGKILVTSELGSGSCFRISLPLVIDR